MSSAGGGPEPEEQCKGFDSSDSRLFVFFFLVVVVCAYLCVCVGIFCSVSGSRPAGFTEDPGI